MLKRILVLGAAMVGLTAAPVLADETQYPPQDDLKIEVSTTALCPGDSVTVSGEGFEPGSSVAVTLASNGTNLGSADVQGDGAFSFDTTISETQEPGDYTVQVAGTAPDGSEVTANAALEVQDCDDSDDGDDSAAPATTAPPADGPDEDLPVTGSNSTWTLIKIGLALAAIGGALLALARRRRAAMSVA
jgi:LPXTG-motif cell wall-anchored protein